MLKQSENLQVVVSKIEQITPEIKRFTLLAASGMLPAFTGGSHILVHIEHDGKQHVNAYSLMNSPADQRHYQISVLLEPHSKGGSAFMHSHVALGDTLEISAPKNLFGLAHDARKHLLIAGGIGITPILAQLDELHARGADYFLHYAFRSMEQGAFIGELVEGIHRERIAFHVGSEGKRMDIDALLGAVEPNTHVYVCGPQRLTDAVLQAADKHGIPSESIHTEQFSAKTGLNGQFTVTLAKSCKEVVVGPGVTILSALEKSGITDVPFMCRSGVCGTCETAIIEGEAEHLDQYLTNEEKEAHKTLLVCVSRARTSRIVLDL